MAPPTAKAPPLAPPSPTRSRPHPASSPPNAGYAQIRSTLLLRKTRHTDDGGALYDDALSHAAQTLLAAAAQLLLVLVLVVVHGGDGDTFDGLKAVHRERLRDDVSNYAMVRNIDSGRCCWDSHLDQRANWCRCSGVVDDGGGGVGGDGDHRDGGDVCGRHDDGDGGLDDDERVALLYGWCVLLALVNERCHRETVNVVNVLLIR